MLLGAHDRDAPHDLPARLVTVKQERGQAAARVVRGARDHDEVPCDARAGDEPFPPLDDPTAVPAAGARPDHARVRPAARRRLGHGEGRAHPALDDRPQPALLLGGRADRRQQHHVAVVGCCRVEDHRAEDRAVRLLVHHGHGEPRQAHPAELLWRLRRPKALGPRLRLQLGQPIEPDVLVLVPGRPVRLDGGYDLGHEIARPSAQPLELRTQGEVHRPFSRPGAARPRGQASFD